MNTQEVANRLIDLCRKGKNMQAIQELYSQNIQSREMPGMPQEITSGKDRVVKKSEA